MKRRSLRKKRRKVPVPVASMGDIAFLLIIFFMLLSELAKDKDLNVVLPLSQYVEKPENRTAARVAIDAEGEIYLDGERVETAKEVEFGIDALLNDSLTDSQRHVEFKCDSALTRDKFEPVLKAIAEGGGIVDAVGELP